MSPRLQPIAVGTLVNLQQPALLPWCSLKLRRKVMFPHGFHN